MSSPETVYEPGRVLRIKTSEHLDVGGESVTVLERYRGKYPSIEGATYYKVRLLKTRERCRYCGGPRELAESAPCRPTGYEEMDAHSWRDASVLDVHEDWLEVP